MVSTDSHFCLPLYTNDEGDALRHWDALGAERLLGLPGLKLIALRRQQESDVSKTASDAYSVNLVARAGCTT